MTLTPKTTSPTTPRQTQVRVNRTERPEPQAQPAAPPPPRNPTSHSFAHGKFPANTAQTHPRPLAAQQHAADTRSKSSHPRRPPRSPPRTSPRHAASTRQRPVRLFLSLPKEVELSQAGTRAERKKERKRTTLTINSLLRGSTRNCCNPSASKWPAVAVSTSASDAGAGALM